VQHHAKVLAIGLLGGIFAYAVDCGMIDISPVIGVKRFTDRKGNRYLSQQELAALGEGLRQAETEGENPSALAIIKLLVFTGARKGEIETLKWSEMDFQAGYLKLADSKTGQKAIPLTLWVSGHIRAVQLSFRLPCPTLGI
jgi:integrase